MTEALNPPSKIVIIGAGPIGIESALYGRYLGYDVTVLEKSGLAQNVLIRGDAELEKPYEYHVTPLGLQALRAQSPSFQPLPAGTQITANDWYSQYLVPVAESDLLRGKVLIGQTATRIELLDTDDDESAVEPDGDDEFYDPDLPTSPKYRVITQDATGEVNSHEAAAVVIATGVDAVIGHPKPPADGIYWIGVANSDNPADYAMPNGFVEIRELFSRIGDRKSLNLYETMP